MQEVKPLTLISILVFFISVFGAYFWVSGEAANEHGVGAMYVTDSHISFVLEDTIYQYDGDVLLSKIDLNDFGITDLMGGIGYFSNGDLLLRAETFNPTLEDNIKIYLRRSGSDFDEDLGAILLRCSVESKECEPFITDQTFTRTYRAFILENDDVIIAKTYDHALYWYDSEGQQKDKATTGFKFPNQAELIDGKIYVANTNKNEITVIPVVNDGFSDEQAWQHISLEFPEAKKSGHVWPNAVVVIDEGLIVLSQENGMAHGKLFKLNKEGEYLETLQSQSGSDLLLMRLFKDSIYVADFENITTYQYDLTGRLIGEYLPDEMFQHFDSIRENKHQFQLFQLAIGLVGGLVFVALFIYAIVLEKQRLSKVKEESQVLSDSIDTSLEKPFADDPAVHWLEKSDTFKRLIKFMPLALFISMVTMPVLLMPLFTGGMDDPEALDGMMTIVIYFFALVLMALLIMKLLKKQVDTAIGVKGHWVLLRSAEAEVRIAEAKDVKYTSSALVIDDVHVACPLGGENKLYKKGELETYIFPLKDQFQKMSEIEFSKYLWEKRDSTMTLLAPVIILGLVFVLLVEFGVIVI